MSTPLSYCEDMNVIEQRSERSAHKVTVIFGSLGIVGLTCFMLLGITRHDPLFSLVTTLISIQLGYKVWQSARWFKNRRKGVA